MARSVPCSCRTRSAPGKSSNRSKASANAVASPEVRRRLETEGYIPVGNAPEDFSRFVQAEITRWAKVVKFSGARPE